MAWIYSQALEASPSHSPLGCDPSPTVRTTDTLKACWSRVCTPANCIGHPFGTTCAPFGATCCPESISFMAASPARTSALRAAESAWVASGPAWYERYFAFAKRLGRPLSFWRMCRRLELEGPSKSGKHWPASGMIVGGTLFPLRPWARHTSASVGGSWLPTPTAHAFGTGGNGVRKGTQRQVLSLETMARHNLWPPTPKASDPTRGAKSVNKRGNPSLPAAVFATPTARDWKSGSTGQATNSRPLSEQVGGALNPTWVEWLMGYPSGWTVLEPWAMQLCRRKRAKRSKDSAA
jgi:hypothetical protein